VLGAGQVGCGKGGGVGSGTYGMAQFGGVAGFNQMVARGGQIGATPRMQVAARPQMAARPMFTVQSTWDARHPNWNGSQIAYWSQRIVAFIRNDGSRCSSDSDSHLTAIVQGFLREYPTVADFRRAFMPGSGISLRLTYTVTPQINMWFAQEKDADVAYAASLLASQRCLLTQGGSVSGAPIGQVGCGKGGGVGSGTYGMAQFGGVAGFNQMVARAARPQVQRVARPVPTMQSPWDAKHPNWNGSQIAYWSQRIEAYLKSIPASNRIGLSANWEAQINPWLRRWPDPAQFVSHYFADTRPYIAPAQVPGYWYASGSDAYVAAHAALGFAALVRLGGSVGAPASGTVGANGDACTPYGAAVTDVKPYYYIVQSDDLSNFWKIPEKFNMPTKIGTAWTWQQMRNANLDWVGGFTTVNSACVLAGLYAGAKLKVPANWLEPKPGTKTEPIGGTTTTCGAGQIEMGGQCVNLPPGVTVAIGGSCPSGTTNVSGLCIPNGGYTPPPGQACLPGTIADATTGTCKLPGGAPPPAVIPGIPPVGGVCPTGMTKHSDGLCYAPGTAPPGITPVGLTSDKKTADEGYPTWAWALLGLGGVAGVAGIAYYVKKREDKGDEVEEEIEVEGVEVAGP
jgi:hypothetical protein